jgi:hypothetical protein
MPNLNRYRCVVISDVRVGMYLGTQALKRITDLKHSENLNKSTICTLNLYLKILVGTINTAGLMLILISQYWGGGNKVRTGHREEPSTS